MKADLIKTPWRLSYADFFEQLISFVARTPSKEDPYHAAHD